MTVRKSAHLTTTHRQARRRAKMYLRDKRRPLPRFVLQPISIVIMLVVGVLLIGWTVHAIADDTIVVTATVPAPALTQPAVINSPTDGSVVTSNPITVSGSCPDNSYVNLTRNGTFSGSALCVNQAFQITTNLFVGTNTLNAQDFNVTNQAGPASQDVVIIYRPPAGTTPTAPINPSSPSTNPSHPSTNGSSPLPLLLTSSFTYKTFFTHAPFSWTVTVQGGTAPFSVHSNWQDGTSSDEIVSKDGNFTIRHVFTKGGYYPVQVSIVDNTGQSAVLQVAGLIHDAGTGSIPLGGNTQGPAASSGTAFPHWLIVAWPFYAIVLLMTLSFYLGERQELLNLTTRQLLRKKHA